MLHPWYTPPADYAVPAHWTLSDDDRSYLHEQTWALILKGEDDIDVYMEHLGEELDEAGVDEEEAERFFASVIASRRAQQQQFGGLPRSALTEAFDELESLGIVARQDFTCCGTCASAEIGDERDDSKQWRGYVYFHTQDTDRIAEDRETYIGYGVFLDAYISEPEWDALSEQQKEETYNRLTTELMEAVAFPVFEKHGIGVNWNRDLGTRILLSNVDYFTAV